MKFDESLLYNIKSDYQGIRYSLFDLAIWKNGLAFKKINFSDRGLPVIKIAELNNGISSNTSLTQGDYGKEVFVQWDDLLFSWSGNPQTSIDVFRYRLPDGWLNQHIFKVTANSNLVTKDFLYYTLKYLKPYFTQIATNKQTTGLGHVTIADLKRMSVVIPQKEIQEQITSILKAIDDKIEVNSNINENLEQQAVVLFRSWFSAFSLSPNSHRVNSEFGEIPEDFTVIKVGSLPILVTDYVSNGSFASLKANVSLYQEPNYAYFIRNTDLKSGSFGVFVDQHSYEFLSKSTLYGGEIIISNVGDVGSVFLCPKLDAHMTLGNNIIMLRPEDDHLRYYLYIWFKYLQGQALIQGIKGGSAQPKFNKTDFKNTSILIPPKDILSRFHETVAPMFEMISHRQTETSRLANLRDTLLPHLMSGEIDVSKLDI